MLFRFLTCMLLSFALQAQAEGDLVADIYKNALINAEEGAELEVLKHWFLFQSIADPQLKSPYQARFLSLLWSALGHLDQCPESIAADQEASRLWSLVTYNYLIRHRKAQNAADFGDADTLEAFERAQQRRRVHYEQVLDPEEIKSLKTYRDQCTVAVSVLENPQIVWEGEKPPQSSEERAKILYQLLQIAEKNLQNIVGREWLELRSFSYKLYLSGSSPAAIEESLPFLLSLVRSPLSTLKAMDAETRLYLMQTLDRSSISPEQKIEIMLRWLDLAIELEEISLIDSLIARLDKLQPENRAEIWQTKRAQALLELAERKIFSEGSSIALLQGLAYYDAQNYSEALRSLAIAIRLAPQARAPGLDELALQWIKHILIQFRFDQRLLSFVRSYLEAATLKRLSNDLVWASVLAGEGTIIKSPQLSSLINHRLKQNAGRLQLLADRRTEAFKQDFALGLKNKQRLTLQFAGEMVEQVEKQTFPIIENLLGLLMVMSRQIQESLTPKQMEKPQVQALLKNFDRLLVHYKAADHAHGDRQLRGLDQANLGTLRVEPSRDVPWVFPAPMEVAVDVFQEVPYRLAPRAMRQGLELKWQLGKP